MTRAKVLMAVYNNYVSKAARRRAKAAHSILNLVYLGHLIVSVKKPLYMDLSFRRSRRRSVIGGRMSPKSLRTYSPNLDSKRSRSVSTTLRLYMFILLLWIILSDGDVISLRRCPPI